MALRTASGGASAIFGSRLIRSMAGTYLARIGVLLFGFAVSVLVARVLGPAERGLYAVAAMLVATGVQLGNLGLHSVNVYVTAREPARLPALLGNSLLFSLLVGGAATAIAWWAFVTWPALSPLPNSRLLALALAWLPLGMVVLLLQQLLVGMERFRVVNYLELGNAALVLALMAGLLALHRFMLLTAFGAAFLSAAALAAGLLWYLLARTRFRVSCSFPLFREHFRYGLKVYLGSLASFLVIRVDLLMVQYLRGAEQTGYYSVATQLASTVFMLPMVVGTVLFPRFSAMRDAVARWDLARRAALHVGWIMTLAAVAGWVLAGWLIPLVFGVAYRPAVVPFDILLAAVAILAVNTVFMNYFSSEGLPMIAVIAPLVALAVNIGANLVVIPRWGISGAAWTSVLAYALMLALSLAYLWIRPREAPAAGVGS